jgi:hypothetical protein
MSTSWRAVEMKVLHVLRKSSTAALLAVVVAIGWCASVYAGNSETTVEIQTGIVVVDRGEVGVALRSGEVVVPSNGAGLLRAGAILPGDEVDVRIIVHTKEKGRHKHRGHVTVLK